MGHRLGDNCNDVAINVSLTTLSVFQVTQISLGPLLAQVSHPNPNVALTLMLTLIITLVSTIVSSSAVSVMLSVMLSVSLG